MGECNSSNAINAFTVYQRGTTQANLSGHYEVRSYSLNKKQKEQCPEKQRLMSFILPKTVAPVSDFS